MLSRRLFLKYGFLGTTALAAGTITLGMQSTRVSEPPEPLGCLSIEEYSILVAIADCLLPSNPPFPAASELRVALHIDTLLTTVHSGNATEIKLLLALFENAASNMMFDQHWRPFTQSTTKQQFSLLDSWRTSQLSFRRTAFRALSGLCGAAYYAQPKAYQLVGYNGPPQSLKTLVERAAQN